MNQELYTLRNGLREKPKDSSIISTEHYELLCSCCDKYAIYLTHIYNKREQDDWTKQFYTTFDNHEFNLHLNLIIPFLESNRYYLHPTYHSHSSNFEPLAVMDYIEYIAQNMMDVDIYWNHPHYKNYEIYECLPTCKIFAEFQNKINSFFSDASLLYKLTNEKKVERVLETSVLSIINESEVLSIKEKGTRELLKEALELFKNPRPDIHKLAADKLWDALERLKTYYGKNKSLSATQIVQDMSGGVPQFFALFNDEFNLLTKIGNDYRIRHHETYKIDITDDRYYDYFFNRCFSLIALAVQYLK